jgi:tRNA nucleotidyltransferase (CCA-adding enzyme)
VLLACECDARGRLGHADDAYPQAQRLQTALEAALTVDTAPIAQAVLTQSTNPAKAGLQVARAIADARAQTVARTLVKSTG